MNLNSFEIKDLVIHINTLKNVRFINEISKSLSIKTILIIFIENVSCKRFSCVNVNEFILIFVVKLNKFLNNPKIFKLHCKSFCRYISNNRLIFLNHFAYFTSKNKYAVYYASLHTYVIFSTCF